MLSWDLSLSYKKSDLDIYKCHSRQTNVIEQEPLPLTEQTDNQKVFKYSKDCRLETFLGKSVS